MQFELAIACSYCSSSDEGVPIVACPDFLRRGDHVQICCLVSGIRMLSNMLFSLTYKYYTHYMRNNPPYLQSVDAENLPS
jgi:hypothetical protein